MTKTLEFKWTVSRGRDTYGYNICTLYVDGKKAAACNGGGYDMQGTSLGNWVAREYADRLNALKPEQMPEQSHWERAANPRRICRKGPCFVENVKNDADPWLPGDAETCPKCGGETDIDYHDGKRVDDGRYFYGLTYHDPNYDPGKAVIEHDDGVFGAKKGQTVESAEKEGKSLGLDRYQALYRASSKVPTERHTVPLIDGGCGFRSVEDIMKAIGLKLEYIPTKSKGLTIYRLHDEAEKRVAA